MFETQISAVKHAESPYNRRLNRTKPDTIAAREKLVRQELSGGLTTLQNSEIGDMDMT
jgi:hypothetical protein